MEPQDLLFLIMDMAGTIAFAASGAMVAIRRDMDVFGVCVLGVITTVGGGMTRDIILGNVPSALQNPRYVLVGLITSLVVFCFLYKKQDLMKGEFKNWYDFIMLIMDTVGLAIFTAVGVITGISYGYIHNTFLLVFLGTLTGVGGGVLRDIMAGMPPYIFVKHIYACASIAGAFCCTIIYRKAGQSPAIIVSSLVVMLIRFMAAYYKWNLPKIHLQVKEEQK